LTASWAEARDESRTAATANRKTVLIIVGS
jgi:hypothetical protein